MSARLGGIVMALAAACLVGRRREWAAAMEAEFEAASEEGRALPFALGCLAAVWRDLPAHEQGRFAIASHLLVFALMLPAAAALASSLLGGFPSSLGQGSAPQMPLFNDANYAAVPTLAALVLLLAALHLRIAWLVLERDFAAARSAAMATAAATVTLLIFSAIVFLSSALALAQAAALAIELGALSALERWDAQTLGETGVADHA